MTHNGALLLAAYQLRFCSILHKYVSSLTQFDIGILSVRHVRVLYRNGLMFITISSPHGSPINLVLWVSIIFAKFRSGHPCRGAEYRWGIKILRFSTNTLLYLANDTRQHQSYYGMLIGTRMRSIKWCHFQRPWTTLDPNFKVTDVLWLQLMHDLLAIAKFLFNDTKRKTKQSKANSEFCSRCLWLILSVHYILSTGDLLSFTVP